MEFKRRHFLVIAIFVIGWAVVIGWGMFKTGLKLSKEKSPATKEKTILSLAEKKPKETQKEKATTPAQKKTPPESTPAPQEARLVSVKTFRVKAVDFHDVLPVMGTVKGKTEIELRFEINGVIEKINFHEGERIKKGELIACLDTKDAELRLSYAKNKLNSHQAAYDSAQKKLEVHQKLYEAGAIIKTKLEEVELETQSAKFQLETTRSEMELAENELKKTCIYAAKDGVMGPREAEEKEFVTAQDKVGSLLEISEVFVEVGVVERDIDKIKLAQKAKVYVDAYPHTVFEGTLDRIFPIVEGKSRTLTAKIRVPNPDGFLFPGMFSRAEIFICELENALIIPAVALIQAGGGVTLVPIIPRLSLKKTKDEVQTGTVELARVAIGYLTSDYAQISDGLNADDLVVIETEGELKDNIRVKIVAIEEGGF